MNNRIWYKNWIWYYHFALLLLFLFFILWGLYLCSFKEYWYAEYSSFFNFDILMSFLSVQVNIMTIVWIIFFLIFFNKRKYGVNSDRFRIVIMNWNLIVFIIFWIGIIYYIHQDAEFISSYSKNQIICTIVTHFIAPLSLIIIYWFVMGNEKIEYFNMWKKFDIYIAMLYPLLYMFYIYIRGLMYEKDSLSFGAWPYPFLDFENLFIGNSIFSYMILLSVIFFFWITAHHLFLMYINNLAFKFKIKNINKEL